MTGRFNRKAWAESLELPPGGESFIVLARRANHTLTPRELAPVARLLYGTPALSEPGTWRRTRALVFEHEAVAVSALVQAWSDRAWEELTAGGRVRHDQFNALATAVRAASNSLQYLPGGWQRFGSAAPAEARQGGAA